MVLIFATKHDTTHLKTSGVVAIPLSQIHTKSCVAVSYASTISHVRGTKEHVPRIAMRIKAALRKMKFLCEPQYQKKKEGRKEKKRLKNYARILLILGFMPAVAVPIDVLVLESGNSAHSSAIIDNAGSSLVGTQKTISVESFG